MWTIDLGDGENRFSPGWLDVVEGLLDEAESSTEPVVVVVTSTGKFFSNGLDLEWVVAHPDLVPAYVSRIEWLLARVLTLPVPTVAAINGHAFGAGAMLAMACDQRVMREDRGFLCFPEVDIRIPFSPGMSALAMCKLTPRAAVDSMTTGRRFSGPDALVAGLVDRSVTLDHLIDEAVAMVEGSAGKHRRTLGQIKATMFSDVVALLRGEASEQSGERSVPGR